MQTTSSTVTQQPTQQLTQQSTEQSCPFMAHVGKDRKLESSGKCPVVSQLQTKLGKEECPYLKNLQNTATPSTPQHLPTPSPTATTGKCPFMKQSATNSPLDTPIDSPVDNSDNESVESNGSNSSTSSCPYLKRSASSQMSSLPDASTCPYLQKQCGTVNLTEYLKTDEGKQTIEKHVVMFTHASTSNQ